jgi:hypothetical protein
MGRCCDHKQVTRHGGFVRWRTCDEFGELIDEDRGLWASGYSDKTGGMKKLIPLVLGVWMAAVVGCTTTSTTTTSTTTRQRQPNASIDPTLDNTRSPSPMNMGPR